MPAAPRPVRTPLLLALTLAALSGPAWAAPKDEARRHFNAGLELIAQGDHAAGIAEFERAYELVPHPAVLYNIARAYADIQDYEAAIRYFELYLATEPVDRTEVEQSLNTLRARLAAQQAAPATSSPTPSATSSVPSAGYATTDELAELRRHAEELGALAERLAEREAAAIAEAETPDEPDEPDEPTPTEPPPDTPLELGGEGLVEDLYERVVVTASRFGQDPLDSPAAVTLITQEDIRLSSASSLPELLQLAPGVDVMQLAAANPDVSIRGFNRRLSNKVLVLIDGRTVYLDFIGTPLWAALPISLDDIDRIEIIRGPGSAIYGANAFAGVVNIITKTPGDPTVHDQASVSVGTRGLARGSLMASGRQGQIAYRAGASYNQLGRWAQDVDLATRPDISSDVENQALSIQTLATNAQLDWRLGQKGFASVSGGLNQGTVEFYSLGALRDFHIDQTSATARADVGWGPIHVRSFYNRLSGNARAWYYPTGSEPLQGPLVSDSFDVEAQGNFTLDAQGNHLLSVGLGYRFKSIDWVFLNDEVKDEHHFNGYIQEVSTLGPLTLNGAFRLDWHPYEEIGFVPSGRLAAIMHLNEGRAIRVNAGNAFRTPTFLEAYTELYLDSGVDGVMVSSQGDKANIQAESIIAAEVGYMEQTSDSWRAEVNAYGYRVDNLIDLGNIYPEDAQVGGIQEPPGAYVAGISRFENEDITYWAYGGELVGAFYGVPGLDVSANVALEQIRAVAAEETTINRAHPQLKSNLSVGWRTPWTLDLGTQVSFVGGQTWPLRSFNADGQVVYEDADVDPYVILSSKLIWHPFDRDDVELSANAWNWLASIVGPHREHPIGQPVGARYFGNLTYRF
ncbi:MAG: TonB-dependent receptor [Alphaproteobacteria bacterium]|nr:TonB-dependent receptor [Alphaproteobacteria bacterium]